MTMQGGSPHSFGSHVPAPGTRLAAHPWSARELSRLADALGAASFGLTLPGLDRGAEVVLGWGDKPSARRTRAFAARRGLVHLTVEDGFLRSVGLGKRRVPSLSRLIDDLGPHYDARRASRLERLILETELDATMRDRAAAFRSFVVCHGLDKYNLPIARATSPLPRKTGRRILLVDQTAGDLAIAGAFAGPDTFAAMVAAARADVGDGELWIRPHPDVTAGLARSAVGAAGDGIATAPAELTLENLVDAVDAVYTVSSQFGFDALLRGVPVATFGVPFFAGWGPTDDRARGEAAEAALARRGGGRDLDALVHAALLAYPVYLDPLAGRLLSPETAVERLRIWRDQARRFGAATTCVGFSAWKRPHVATYLKAVGEVPRFGGEASAIERARPGTSVAVWGLKAGEDAEAAVRARGGGFLRVEDGFVRSVGLGSDFTFPLSLCFDGRAIYYDARRTSDLEAALATGPVGPGERARAADLRRRLVTLNVTKYNLAGPSPDGLERMADGRRTVFVPGQVPDDHSIRIGRVLPVGNLDLVRRVRAENPDAFVIFKEHPELVTGNRPGLTDPSAFEGVADLVLYDGDTAHWMTACDAVHVMTSLAGFEALLRGKPVTCWGAPFYSGWGLTDDRVDTGRRGVRLELDDLVWHVLFAYALYRLPDSHLPATPEEVLDEIERLRNTDRGASTGPMRSLKRSLDYVAGQIRGWAGL